MNVVQKSKTVLCHEIGEELVLFNKNNKKGYILSKTGVAIWNLCDGKHTVDDIITELLLRYHKKKNEIKNDVEEFITILKAKKFVK